MQDHADEAPLANIKIEGKGGQNPACCHGNKTGMLILWSTCRILLRKVKHL